LQDTLSVLEASLLIVRTILGFHENSGEHIITKDFTPEVSVILSVITTGKMAETGSKVSARCHWNSSVNRGKFLKDICSFHVFGLSVLDVMDSLVKDTERELAHGENTSILVLGSGEFLAKLFTERFFRLVVAG